MNKTFLILLLITIVNIGFSLKSMEQPSASESLWTLLPYELHHKILSYVGLDKATSFEQILGKLKELETKPMFSTAVKNKAFIASIGKKYIEKYKDQTYKEFFEAIENNKKSLVQAFIEAGINIDAQDKFGDTGTIWPKDTALIMATRDGNEDMVEILLKAGANVNIQNIAGTTPLKMAKWAMVHWGRGSIKILDMLRAAQDTEVRKNITQNKEAAEKKFLEAVEDGKAALVQSLIASGVDINAKDKFGDTALMMATRNGETAMVELLLNAGADANLENIAGTTALKMAKAAVLRGKGNKKILEILGQAQAESF